MVLYETERLILREFVESDWSEVHAYSSDERLVYYLNWGPNTEQDTKQFVEHALRHQQCEPRTLYEVVIVLKETDEVVGNGSVRAMCQRHREGEVHCIIRRDRWGRGYGTEAIRALTAFAFDTLELHRVFSAIDPEDVATARVFERIGYTREGHLREHKWLKEEWRDSLIYAVLEDEWAHICKTTA